MKIIKSLRRFIPRCRIALRIMFKEKHGICIVLTEAQLRDLIIDSKINGGIQLAYFGMMGHQVAQTIKIAGNLLDETDIICSKAKFDVMVEEKVSHSNECPPK